MNSTELAQIVVISLCYLFFLSLNHAAQDNNFWVTVMGEIVRWVERECIRMKNQPVYLEVWT